MLQKQSTRSTEFDTQLFHSQRNIVTKEKQKLHDLIKASLFPRVACEITLK